MEDAETALMTLADPLLWRRHPDEGQPEVWETEYNDTLYYVHSPQAAPGDVDALMTDLSWTVALRLYDNASERMLRAPAALLAEGRRVCLRHALTGDTSEVEALSEEARKACQPFEAQRKEAHRQISDASNERNIAALYWVPKDDAARKFYAIGLHDRYIVRFDPQRRWEVGARLRGRILPERRFQTRHLAKMACSYHARTGQWLGTIPEEVSNTPVSLPVVKDGVVRRNR